MNSHLLGYELIHETKNTSAQFIVKNPDRQTTAGISGLESRPPIRLLRQPMDCAQAVYRTIRHLVESLDIKK